MCVSMVLIFIHMHECEIIFWRIFCSFSQVVGKRLYFSSNDMKIIKRQKSYFFELIFLVTFCICILQDATDLELYDLDIQLKVCTCMWIDISYQLYFYLYDLDFQLISLEFLFIIYSEGVLFICELFLKPLKALYFLNHTKISMKRIL